MHHLKKNHFYMVLIFGKMMTQKKIIDLFIIIIDLHHIGNIKIDLIEH
jgi:hypothetical protein